MFRRMKALYGNVRQTLEEGHYCAEDGSVLSDIWDEFKEKLPEIPKLDIAKKLPFLTKIFKNKVVWTTVAATISTQSILFGALALVGSGISFYAMEYLRCRRARNQVITETNFAGQTVRGRRADLSKLHKAQEKILNLSATFNDVAAAPPKEILDIIDSVHESRRRVLVVDGGRFGASHGTYHFSRPGEKIEVEETPVAPVPELPVRAETGLRDAWQNRRDDEVVDRIIALEEALPPQVLDKVRRRRLENALSA